MNITPADGVSNTTNSDRILGTSSGDTFQDPKQAQDYRHDLFAHVDVYSFGDKYDISGLKDLAATKFKDCFVGLNPTSTTDFHVLVQKVYQCTSPSDSGLRKTLMDCCAQYVDDLLATPSFRDVVQNEDGVGLELLQKVSGLHGKSVREFCQRIRDLELVVGNLKLEKTQITNLYTVANQNYQDLDDKLDKAIASARAIEVCRNCEEVFGGCFDRSIRAPNSHIILRCKKCRCRHYL